MSDWKLTVLKHLNEADLAAIRAISMTPGVNAKQAEDLLRELRIAADRYRQVVNRAAMMVDALAESEELSYDGGSLDEFLEPDPESTKNDPDPSS